MRERQTKRRDRWCISPVFVIPTLFILLFGALCLDVLRQPKRQVQQLSALHAVTQPALQPVKEVVIPAPKVVAAVPSSVVLVPQTQTVIISPDESKRIARIIARSPATAVLRDPATRPLNVPKRLRAKNNSSTKKKTSTFNLNESERRRVLAASNWPTEMRPKIYQVVACESEWNPYAQGPTNDHGLAQIQAKAHRDKFTSVRRLYDPVYNLNIAWDVYQESMKSPRGGWWPWRKTNYCHHLVRSR